MRNTILIIFTLTNCFYALGQTNQKVYYPSGQLKHEGKMEGELLFGTQKYYYENGNLKQESYYDNHGLWLGYKEWDNYGNLLRVEKYKSKYLDYPKRDFSSINWTKLEDGVYIFKLNVIDTSTQAFTDTSIFSAHYICYFENGTMLDNSYARSNPLYARIDYMIDGFKTGIRQMKPGEVAFVKIEPKRAFGDKVAGNVPPNSTLIYYLELISLE